MQKFTLTKQNAKDIIGRFNKFMDSCRREGTVCFGYTNRKNFMKPTRFFNFRIYKETSCDDIRIMDGDIYIVTPNNHVHKLQYGTNIYFNGGNIVALQFVSKNGYKPTKMVFYRTSGLNKQIVIHSRMYYLTLTNSIYGIQGVTPTKNIRDYIDMVTGYIGDQFELIAIPNGEDLLRKGV